MSFEIEGKVHKIFPTETKGESFQVRDFVIETTSGTYVQYIKFQLTQDRCALMDNYNDGDMIKVHFDLRGREWNEKYFTNLNAWRIEGATGTTAPVNEQPVGNTNFPSADDAPTATDADTDDLPF